MLTVTRLHLALMLVALFIGTAGCAGTAPKPTFSHKIVADAHVGSPDTVDVTIDATDSVKILPMERERLTEKIKAKIDLKKATNPRAGTARAFQVALHLTRYEKGSRFARAMLAGIGQIHIDGTVSVYSMPEHALVGEFDLQKTFAWGGIYGASTSIEEIEETFADGVAATVTGQEQAPPKQKT